MANRTNELELKCSAQLFIVTCVYINFFIMLYLKQLYTSGDDVLL